MFKKSLFFVVGSVLLAAPILSAQQQPQRPAPLQSIEDRTSGLKKFDG